MGENAGYLDAEFEAFQAGRSVGSGYAESGLLVGNGPTTSVDPSLRQQGPSEWVSDFQNLQLSKRQSLPIFQSQFHHNAPRNPIKSAGWHQDFLRHQDQSSYKAQRQQRQDTRHYNGLLQSHSDGLLPLRDNVPSLIAQQKRLETLADNDNDDVAFENAFEAVRSELLQAEEQSHHQDVQRGQDLYRTEDNGDPLSPEHQVLLNHNRMDADQIHEDSLKSAPEHNVEADADELARTAGQLLENVKGDESQKFQKSSFLSLMRHLRDKEVRVEGDSIVGVSMPSSNE